MESGLARLAAACVVVGSVLAAAIVIDHHFDPAYNRSVEDCEDTAVRALPKGARFDHGLGGGAGDVTYRLPQDPAPSVDAITKKLRARDRLLRVGRRSTDPYDDVVIVVKTPCTSTNITVRRVSPPPSGATAQIESLIED